MRSGVTLIELLLIIALMAIIGATAIPVGSGFLTRTYQKNKTNELISLLRTAQINSLNGKQDIVWGVEVGSGLMKLFAEGQPAFDQVFTIPGSISITGQKIIFNRVTGNLNTPTSFTISNQTGDTSVVTVNVWGTVDVN